MNIKYFLTYLLIFPLLFSGTIPVSAKLFDVYQSRLPSISQRKSVATECGIKNYQGTSFQNNNLEKCLNTNSGMLGGSLNVAPYTLTAESSSTAATTTNLFGNFLPQSDSVFNLGSTNKKWNNLFVRTISVNTSTDQYLYFSPTGSNTGNNCTASSTPCLGINYTLSQIPLMNGSRFFVQATAAGVNTIDGSGTVAFASYLSNRVGVNPITNRPTYIEIDGATSNAASTTLKGLLGQHCIDITSQNLEVALKNITIDSCSSAILNDGGYLDLYGVNASNFTTRAYWGRHGGYVFMDDSVNGYTFTATGTAAFGFNVDTGSTWDTNDTHDITFNRTSPAIYLQDQSQFMNHYAVAANLIINGVTSTQPGGLLVASGSQMSWKGNINISGYNSFSNAYGIQITENGLFRHLGSGTITFNTVNQPIEIESGGTFTDVASTLYSFTNVVNYWRLANDAFNLTAVDHTASTTLFDFVANPKFGFDYRYGSLIGTNIWTGINTISGALTLTGGFSQHRLAVNTPTYNILTTDGYIAASSTSATSTYTLPNAAIVSSGYTVTIKDRSCKAGTNNITVTSTSSTIDTGGGGYIMSTNCQSTQFVSDGVGNWEID